MAHHSTILAQLLKLVPRHEFEALARRFHKGRRRAQRKSLKEQGLAFSAGGGTIRH